MKKATPTKPPRPAARKPLRRKGSARVIQESVAPTIESQQDPNLFERPDGWYWAAPDGHQEFGPFSSRALAGADRDRFDQQGVDGPETVQEAESEIGMSDWIDAETGQPAEGQSPPHLEEK
jgi:hypothetical protein